MIDGVRFPHAHRRRAARLRVAGIAAVTAAAAAAGAFAGTHASSDDAPAAPAPAPAVLDAGVARLPVPEGWAVGAPRFAVAGLGDAAGMWSASADAVFAARPPEDPSLLPALLVQSTGGAPPPRRVTGAVRGWRYDVAAADEPGRVNLVVLPATTGVVTLGCHSPPGGAAWSNDECVDAAQTVELREGSWIAPGPEAAVRIALPAEIARLNRGRGQGRRALTTAGSAQARADAARSVARAYAGTASALRPLAGEGAPAALVGLLDRLAGDHRRLATAHANRYRALAVRAGAAIERDEARLGRLIAALAPPAGA